MAYFSDINVFYDLLKETFAKLMSDPAIKEKALESKLLVRFVYDEPEGEVWIDCTGDEVVLIGGSLGRDAEPHATLLMETDTAHMFWLGGLNLLGAMSSGLIRQEGDVPPLLKLLPVIKPAYAIYIDLLKDKGLEDLIIDDDDDDDDDE